jgi:acyl carrier protein
VAEACIIRNLTKESVMDDFATLRDIFRVVFDDNELTVAPDTSLVEIVDWDSIAHVKVVLSLEEEFGIQFTEDEVVSVETVSDFLVPIRNRRKLAA